MTLNINFKNDWYTFVSKLTKFSNHINILNLSRLIFYTIRKFYLFSLKYLEGMVIKFRNRNNLGQGLNN